MVASLELCLLPLRDTATGPPVAVKTPHITSVMGPWVHLSEGVKGHGGVSKCQKRGQYQKDWSVWKLARKAQEGQSLIQVGLAVDESGVELK